MAISRIALEGLPHSEIFGSKPVCGSPKLIAAYHVLHRRPAPRHPPYALSSLTTAFTLLETLQSCTTFPSRFSKDLRLSMIRGCFDPQWRPARRHLHPRGGAALDVTARPSPKREGRALTSPPRPVSPGGADRARTGDLLVANQALSQLSYSPGRSRSGGPKWIRTTDLTVISRAL